MLHLQHRAATAREARRASAGEPETSQGRRAGPSQQGIHVKTYRATQAVRAKTSPATPRSHTHALHAGGRGPKPLCNKAEVRTAPRPPVESHSAAATLTAKSRAPKPTPTPPLAQELPARPGAARPVLGSPPATAAAARSQQLRTRRQQRTAQYHEGTENAPRPPFHRATRFLQSGPHIAGTEPTTDASYAALTVLWVHSDRRRRTGARQNANRGRLT